MKNNQKTAQWYNPMQWLKERDVRKNVDLLNPNQQIVTNYYKEVQKRINELSKINEETKKAFNNSTDKNYNEYMNLEKEIKESVDYLNGILVGLQKIANQKTIIKIAQAFDIDERQKQYFIEIQDTKIINSLKQKFQEAKNRIKSNLDLLNKSIYSVNTPESQVLLQQIQPALTYFGVINTQQQPQQPQQETPQQSEQIQNSEQNTPQENNQVQQNQVQQNQVQQNNQTNIPQSSDFAASDISNKAKELGIEPNQALRLMRFFVGDKVVNANNKTNKKNNKLAKAPKSWKNK